MTYVLLPVLGFTLCLWLYWQFSILLIILHGHWMYQRSTALMRSQHIWFLILLFWLYISPCPISSRLVKHLLDPWSCWFMTTSVSESSAFRISANIKSKTYLQDTCINVFPPLTKASQLGFISWIPLLTVRFNFWHHWPHCPLYAVNASDMYLVAVYLCHHNKSP